MTHIISATDQTFDSIVQNNPALIVDFWAPTCGPCRQMEPGLEKIAQNYGAQLKILKVNVNENPRTSARFMIRSLPTLLFFKNGMVKTQLIGAVNTNQIERLAREVIA